MLQFLPQDEFVRTTGRTQYLLIHKIYAKYSRRLLPDIRAVCSLSEASTTTELTDAGLADTGGDVRGGCAGVSATASTTQGHLRAYKQSRAACKGV